MTEAQTAVGELVRAIENLPCIHSNGLGRHQFRLSAELRNRVLAALTARPAPASDREGLDGEFANLVAETLKGDHNDLRKEAIILRAHRAILAQLPAGYAAGVGDAAKVVRELCERGIPAGNFNRVPTPTELIAGIKALTPDAGADRDH